MTVTPAGRPGPRAPAEHAVRRRRLIEASLELAADGGYDAVLMKTVADRAGVAIATLYRYFPSKVHLLVRGLAVELGRLDESLPVESEGMPGDTPAERVRFVLDRLTASMQRYPRLSEAMTRALMFADASAADEVEAVGAVMESMLSKAIGDSADPARTAAVVRVLGDVWLAGLVSVVTDRATVADLQERLALAVRLLLAH